MVLKAESCFRQRDGTERRLQKQLNESLLWQFPVPEEVLSSHFTNLSRDKSPATFVLALLDFLFCCNKIVPSRSLLATRLLLASQAIYITIELQVKVKPLQNSNSPKSATS